MGLGYTWDKMLWSSKNTNDNNNALSNSYSEDVHLYPDVSLMGLSQVYARLNVGPKKGL